MHARKAWLKGLSPKENRDVPPLKYERVYQLKDEFPELHFSLNGGVKTIDDAKLHLAHLDGVMIGREVYSNPYILAEVDNLFYGDEKPVVTREQVIDNMRDYAERQIEQGARIWHIARHMLGLFQGQAGARVWRRYMSQHGTQKGAGIELLTDGFDALKEAQYQAEKFQREVASR